MGTSDRRSLTFEQAEGLAPLPAQLDRKELSRELRAKLWACIHARLDRAYTDILHYRGNWSRILKDLHVDHHHVRIDKFNPNGIVTKIGDLFEKAECQVYGWLQAVLRHPNCPPDLGPAVQLVLENCRAAYRIEDGVFWPTASTEEADALIQANAALSASQFGGAKTHLKNAASKLTEGDYPASVRESISAAESVARVLEPTPSTQTWISHSVV